jgi:hypothetical protein
MGIEDRIRRLEDMLGDDGRPSPCPAEWLAPGEAAATRPVAAYRCGLLTGWGRIHCPGVGGVPGSVAACSRAGVGYTQWHPAIA